MPKRKPKRRSRRGRHRAVTIVIIAAFAVFSVLVTLQERYDMDFGIPEIPSIPAGIFSAIDDFLGEPASPSLSESAFDDLRVHFIDVGQGDAILIQTRYSNVLIDAGERNQGDNVLAYMRRQGVRELDIIIATHAHSDHIGGIETIIRAMDVHKVIMPEVPDAIVSTTRTYTNLLLALYEGGHSITPARAGAVYDLGGGAYLTIIGPIQDYNSLNDMSVVSRVDFGDVSFLFTGDLERRGELDLVAAGANLSADVLDVAHHGSRSSTSESFVIAVSPRYAIISCGIDNSYGHPRREVLDRLTEHGAEIYRTDLDGTIVVSSDGRELHIDAQNRRQLWAG